MLKKGKLEMYDFSIQLAHCRSPSQVSSVYLHEAWVIYQLNPLHEGKKFQIFTTLIFYELYLESSPREHNLLCELYSFDFIWEHDTL